MATDIINFIPNIAPAVETCPTAVIRDKIIEATRKFCWDTGLWQEELEAQDVVADTAEYDLTDDAVLLVDGATQANTVGEITMLEHIELDEIDLETTAERYLDENERGWRYRDESRPRRFFVKPNRTLRLVYTPNQDITDGMRWWVSMMPLRTATTVEDFIYNDFRLMIEWGSMAYLMEMPGVPWSNPEGAMYYWAKWEKEMDEALDRKESGYGDHQPSYYLKPDYRYV